MENKKNENMNPELSNEHLDAVAAGGARYTSVWKCSKCNQCWTEQELVDSHYDCPRCGNFVFPDPAYATKRYNY